MTRETTPAAVLTSPAPFMFPLQATSGLRRLGDIVLGWLADRRPWRDPDQAAGRMISLWGDRALDMALARSAAETAGFFDTADAGFWTDTARVITGRSDR